MTTAAHSRVDSPVTFWNHVRAVLLLPVTNTVIVPTALLLIFRDAALGNAPTAVELTAVIAASILAAAGLTLVICSVALFVRRGKGTLAPWDPTRVLISEDIYAHSRNPMKAGLFLVLVAECLLLRSPALVVWSACFIVANVVYIRLHEEAGLRRRFGDDYDAYCRRVPRWLPRLTRLPRQVSRQIPEWACRPDDPQRERIS